MTNVNGLQILSTHVSDTFLPNKVLEFYDELKSNYKNNDWIRFSEDDLWKELCFCLLSGNVNYDLAKSVIQVLQKKGLIDQDWLITNTTAQNALYRELSNKNFEPKTKSGDLRKYRFPDKRSQQIVQAAKLIYENTTIKDLLASADSDKEVRNFIALNIPGIGIKESSHFLRNIGFSNSLAILDVHVLNFLHEFCLIDSKRYLPLKFDNYLRIEQILQNFSEYHKMNLAILDLAIWHYMRNKSS